VNVHRVVQREDPDPEGGKENDLAYPAAAVRLARCSDLTIASIAGESR